MKYKLKPEIVDAVKWTGGIDQEEDPEWMIEAIQQGRITFTNVGTPDVTMIINDLGYRQYAKLGEYIVHYDSGVIIPYMAEIFESNYEILEE